ncbi:hypothetical protein [Pseudanabaena sp. ABRG5-3]|uniref:hypothetical protein n=1 Tax=Pseudanabaena sp. ABRG5-3 TaxID=685565 RepID=UPI000DC6E4E5|nr:hypothetical protein [Pseudanabaena sp. ABRG5-3]BBC22799.1 hypothetical protein ABRG53_0542 [Pseudanabaena sp. ABRG5-3]
MNSFEKPQCYCCEKIATTKDHIPPKCFFPKKKDLSDGNHDYTNNLITVPACSDHNNSRSKDDEYTAAVIAMASTSSLALTLFKSKWVRALLRREGLLGKRIFLTAKSARVISRKNRVLIPYNTTAISCEMQRIERVIESIARALYYLESGYTKKCTGSCIIKSPKFLNRDLSYSQDAYILDPINQAFIHLEKYQELGLARKGKNPDVFYYQFFKTTDKNFVIRMVFYNDFTFLVYLQEKESMSSSIIFTV